MRLIQLLCVFVLMMNENSVGANKQDAHSSKKVGPKRTLVVFVHGYDGNADTWINRNTNTSFPNLLSTDPSLGQSIETFVYTYRTSMLGVSMNIEEVASDLELQLANKGALADYNDIVFVAHSLGGHIVRALLLNHRNVTPKVNTIYLFGTPTNGSAVARLFSVISPNSIPKQLSSMDPDSYLSSVANRWNTRATEDGKSLPDQIKTHCAYEKLSTLGVLVVQKASAIALCNGESVAIDTNHIDMVKPVDRNSASYVRLRRALLDRTRKRGLDVKAKQGREDGTPRNAIRASKPNIPATVPAAQINESVVAGKQSESMPLNNTVTSQPTALSPQLVETGTPGIQPELGKSKEIPFAPLFLLGQRIDATKHGRSPVVGTNASIETWETQNRMDFDGISGTLTLSFTSDLLRLARWSTASTYAAEKVIGKVNNSGQGVRPNRPDRSTPRRIAPAIDENQYRQECISVFDRSKKAVARLGMNFGLEKPEIEEITAFSEAEKHFSQVVFRRDLKIIGAFRYITRMNAIASNGRLPIVMTLEMSESEAEYTDMRSHGGEEILERVNGKSLTCAVSLESGVR
jgi:pimeloyl-ACP methyl ester carboxylesterase